MDLYELAVAKALSGSGGGEPVIEALSVTENGTYTAPSGVDGYSPVTVNVSGGGSDPVLLATESLGHVATSSTSATNLQSVTLDLKDASVGIDAFGNYDLLVAITSINSAPSVGAHIKTVTFIVATGDSNAEIHNAGYCIAENFKESADGIAQSRINNTKYGVYVNTVSTTSTGIKLDLQSRYNGNYTGTIDGDYTLRVYGVDLSGII